MTIVAALGLAGGPAASRTLTGILESGRHVETRVIAALAAARSNVRIAPKTLRRLASDAKPVLRFAARVALLCRGSAKDLRKDLSSARESALELQFWRSLCGALDASAPARVAELPVLGAPDSLEELTVRAVLLDAVRHPGVLDFATLDALLRRTDRPVLRRLASLALGRFGMSDRDGDDLFAWIEALPELDRATYFAGLDALPPSLRTIVMRGPGGTRSDEAKRRFRAAAIRLLPATLIQEFTRDYLAANVRDLQGINAVHVEPVLSALLRRVLVSGEEIEFDASTRASLRRVPGRSGLLLACIADGTEYVETPRVARRLGPRLATACRLARRGELGNDAQDANRILWKLFTSEERGRVLEGPGSAMDVFLEEYAALVHDLFVAAAQPNRHTAYVPGGIIVARKDYFAVLGEWLRAWPLPAGMSRR